MKKKDYILIAKVINKVASGWNYDSKYAAAISTVACQLSDELKTENNRFDVEKFLQACSVK